MIADVLRIVHLFRSAFDIETELHHNVAKAVKQCVLDGAAKWSAKICVTG